ncbi:MAG: hypothetical protein IPP49_09690 [Saprospiraceae bacterium]|nr:hypothetical protein [Saprospiraceae bacterium]
MLPAGIKIDEDGNIVPIDTTSATTQPIRDLPDITIYPNPACSTHHQSGASRQI